MNVKQLTELEAQLRCWVPRPPSAALRERIFDAGTVRSLEAAGTQPRTRPVSPLTSLVAAASHAKVSRLAWLAPATALLVLFGFLASQRPHASLSRAAGSGAVLALALSNQNASATLSASLSNDQFALPPESLAATNLRPLNSSFSPRSLSPSTN